MYQGFARMAPLAGRRRRLLGRFAPAASLAALLLGGSVSPAGAVVTIGSNLARVPNSAANYSPRPTFSNVVARLRPPSSRRAFLARERDGRAVADPRRGLDAGHQPPDHQAAGRRAVHRSGHLAPGNTPDPCNDLLRRTASDSDRRLHRTRLLRPRFLRARGGILRGGERRHPQRVAAKPRRRWAGARHRRARASTRSRSTPTSPRPSPSTRSRATRRRARRRSPSPSRTPAS